MLLLHVSLHCCCAAAALVIVVARCCCSLSETCYPTCISYVPSISIFITSGCTYYTVMPLGSTAVPVFGVSPSSLYHNGHARSRRQASARHGLAPLVLYRTKQNVPLRRKNTIHDKSQIRASGSRATFSPPTISHW